MRNIFCLFLLASVVACTSPQIVATPSPTTLPLPVTTPTRVVQPTAPSSAPALTTLAVRERIVLRELPGTGRAPVASVWLDGKVYVANTGSDNVAIIQNDRVIRFVTTGKQPTELAVDAASKRVYVANRTDKTISIIANDQVTLTTSIGEEPRALAFVDHRLFVGLDTKGVILALDPATLQTQATITVPNAFSIINLVGDTTHRRLYAALFDKLGVIDTTNLRVARIIDAKGSYYTLAANPANDSLLTAMYDATANASFLTALDPVSGSTRARVKIGGDPRGAVVNRDGSRIYVANSFSNSISVINARDFTALAEIPVGMKPYALALDENARRLYAANYSNDNVNVIDTQTNQVVATIPLALELTALTTNEATGRVYAASATTDSVFVIEGNRLVKEVPVGRAPADLARDAQSNRILVANTGDDTLSIIDETNFAVRHTQPITRFLSTIAVDNARVFANDIILDLNTLAPIARTTMRGLTINSIITPEFVRVNPNLNRIYAFGGNGIPGSNSRRVTYSIDANTMQQRTILAYGGNSEELVIDPATNRVFMAGTHPLAFTSELGVFDANDTKVFTLTLPARTTGMVYNPQTRHLFLAQAGLASPANPTPLDNTVLILDTTSFGTVAMLNVNAPGKMARLNNTIFVASRTDGALTLIEDVAMPVPPSPTPTRTPTPFPTLPPPPTPTRTTTPSARVSPLPLCAFPIASLAAQRWTPQVAARIGCPTEAERRVNFATQVFERGTMFWREDEKKIIVLLNDKTWSSFDDTWTSALPEDSCPSISVPGIKPKRGFGKVWCEQANVRAKIGAATGNEIGLYSALAQKFERGQMFAGNQPTEIYVLSNDGKWE